MSLGTVHGLRRLALLGLMAVGVCLAYARTAQAQSYVGFTQLRPFVVGIFPVVGNGAVGGVSIDASGILARSTADAIGQLAQERAKALQQQPSADIAVSSKLRKVSLRRLEQAIYEKLKAEQPLDEEMQMLAGLQSVQFIFLHPENHDVIIAGPAEGWTMDQYGTIVGANSQAPVLQLEDLLVALRSISAARETGITCSIDPSSDGLARLQEYFAGNPRMSQAALRQMEQLVGAQNVTVTGVPADSHFARVMVAADFVMKRIAMGLEKSPTRDVPSYMTLLRGPRVPVPQDSMPRWWLTPDYAAPRRDIDGLAFALPASGVKVKTEDSYVSEDGQLERSDEKNPAAMDWAERFSENYQAIAEKNPVFSELRNLMDLSIVAAIVHNPELQAQVGHDFPLFGSSEILPVTSFHVPSTVSSQSSFVKKGNQYVISISGGADLSPGEVLSNATVDRTVLEDRQQALAGAGDNWWWD